MIEKCVQLAKRVSERYTTALDLAGVFANALLGGADFGGGICTTWPSALTTISASTALGKDPSLIPEPCVEVEMTPARV